MFADRECRGLRIVAGLVLAVDAGAILPFRQSCKMLFESSVSTFVASLRYFCDGLCLPLSFLDLTAREATFTKCGTAFL